MLLYSFRFPKKLRRSLGFIVALFAVAFAGSLITDDVQATVNPTQQLPKMKIKSAQDGTAFLNALGWTVTPIEAETMTVTIPKEFDEIYTKYNAIQEEQGLNLEKHRGKRAVRYTYLVSDYPDGTQNVRINLLVHKNKLIGGDVSSLGLDGFMHTLFMPAATNAATDVAPIDGTVSDPSTVTENNGAQAAPSTITDPNGTQANPVPIADPNSTGTNPFTAAETSATTSGCGAQCTCATASAAS